MRKTATLPEKDLASIEKSAQESQLFYKLIPKAALHIVDANLSATAYRLWIYLSSLYQFGDRFECIPSQGELAVRLGVSRRSVLRAVAELEQSNLWEFKIERWKGRNLTGYTPEGNSDKSGAPYDKSGAPCDKFVTPYDKSGAPYDKFVEAHNIDRACEKTIKSNTEFIQTFSEEESAPPPPEIIEIEIIEQESQPAPTGFVEAEDGAYKVNAIALNDQHTTPRDGTSRIEKLREIQSISAKPQEFPWKEADGVTFREEMIVAVWEANQGWYSLPSGAKNKTAIVSRLKALEKNLRKLDDTAIASWNSLQDYWQSAITSIPEVQQVKQAFDDKAREEARARRRNSTIKFTA